MVMTTVPGDGELDENAPKLMDVVLTDEIVSALFGDVCRELTARYAQYVSCYKTRRVKDM